MWHSLGLCVNYSFNPHLILTEAPWPGHPYCCPHSSKETAEAPAWVTSSQRGAGIWTQNPLFNPVLSCLPIMCMHAQLLSCVQFFAALWTIACQAPLSMGFFRQEYWGGLPFPLPGDLPDPGIESTSLISSTLQIDSLLLSQWGRPFPRNK